MGFVKIQKSRASRGNVLIGCTFRLTRGGSAGTLGFNVAGMKFIEKNNINIEIGENVDLFHDPETGQVAIKRSRAGIFLLSKNNKGTFKIHSKDLADIIKQNKGYELRKSNEFDLILVPVEVVEQQQQAATARNKKAS